jgi:signal transduction histidine kinase
MNSRPGALGVFLFVAGIYASLSLNAGGILSLSVACAGLAFAGVAVAAFPARRRYAALSAAAAMAWFLADTRPGLMWIPWPLMVAAALSFPDGRSCRPFARALVALLAASALLPTGVHSPQVTLLLAACVAVSAGWELQAASPDSLSAARTRAGAAVALSLALAIPPAVRWIDPPAALDAFVTSGLALGYSGLVAIGGGILLARLMLGVEESDAESVVALSEEDSSEVLHRLRHQVHASTDRRSRRALDAATDLLERNERLQAELAAAVEDVRTSRRRLVEATDFERRSLRRRLADRALPAIPEIDSLLETVEEATGATLAHQCRAELAAIGVDLDLLAQGLHPVALSRDGLAGLREVGAACPIPVDVHVPPQRLSPEVEAAAWYACTEALANAVKHSHATSVEVDLAVRAGVLAGTVTDDGIGGASFAPDGGLVGLRDRLEAVGASIALASPVGRGTTVRIEVPVG